MKCLLKVRYVWDGIPSSQFIGISVQASGGAAVGSFLVA